MPVQENPGFGTAFAEGLFGEGVPAFKKSLSDYLEESRQRQAMSEFLNQVNPSVTVPAPTAPGAPIPTGSNGQPLGLKTPDVTGVPTQERQPLDMSDPRFMAAAMRLASQPGGDNLLNRYLAIKGLGAPTPEKLLAGETYGTVNKQNGKFTPQYTAPPKTSTKPIPRLLKPDEIPPEFSGIPKTAQVYGHNNEEDKVVIDRVQPIGASGVGAAGGSLSPDAVEAMAQDMLVSGKPPAMGMGGADMRRQVYNRYGQLAKEQGMDAQARQVMGGQTQSEQKNLANITKQRSMVLAFENTATRNIDLALQKAGAVGNSGPRIFNAWKLYVQGKGLGTPEVLAFDAAAHVAANEVAKVTSTTTGNLIPQQEREEYRKLIDISLPLESFKAVVSVLKQDMENRRASYDSEIGDIKKNFPALQGKSPKPVAEVKPSGSPKVGDVKTFPNGNKAKWDGTGWEQIK